MDNVSIIICSCLNKPERKDYLLLCYSKLRSIFKENEIIICFDKMGTEIEGAKCYTHNKGMGHSFNWGIQNAKSDYILQIEDDWVLNKEDIKNSKIFKDVSDNGIIDFFKRSNEIIKKYDGMFRMEPLLIEDWWKWGWGKINENDDFLSLNRPNEYKYNCLSMYYYTNRPHLKRRNLHEEIGWYKENVPPPEVEEDMTLTYWKSGKKVFFPDFRIFSHVGSVSSRGNKDFENV